MNVLMLHNSYRLLGGEDVSTEQEAGMLRRNGHEVELSCKSNIDLQKQSVGERGRILAGTVWNRNAASEISKTMRAGKYDLLHVQNFFPQWSPAVHAAARASGAATVQHLRNYRLMCFNGFFREDRICEDCLGRVPLAGIMHGCYRESRTASAVLGAMVIFNRMRGTWTRDVDAFISNTEFSKRKFIEGGIPEEKIYVKPNFLDEDPGVTDNDGRYAVFAGRLERKKGILALISAMQLVKGISLKVIGEGPLLQDVNRKIQELGLSDRVELCGKKSHAQTMELIKGARVLVMPSEWYETFGRTMMEAFACGIPVIASNLGAMAEVVEDGRTGWLFQPGDSQDLAAKLDDAWSKPAEIRRRGCEARFEFESKYTAASNYQQLKSIYENAIERRKRS